MFEELLICVCNY